MDLKRGALQLLAGSEGKALLTDATLPDSLRGAMGAPAPGSAQSPLRGTDRYLGTYGGNDAIDWVHNAVQFIANTAVSAPYQFEQDGVVFLPAPDPKFPKALVLPPQDYDLAMVFKAPNPAESWKEMVELLVVDFLLLGEAFWLKAPINPTNGRARGIWRLNPQYIQVIPGDQKFIDGYQYRVPGKSEPLYLKAEDVVQFKRPNPHNPYRGLGIIGSAPNLFDMEIALTQTQRQYFRRGTKLSGVLMADRRLPDAVFRRVKREFRSIYAGSDNAYQTAVLEAGLKFQSIQPTAAENQFAILAKLSRDRNYGMFGPGLAQLLAVETTVNPALLQVAQRLFDQKTMRPFLDKLQDRISLDVTQPGWGYDFKFAYEYTMPPEDRIKLAGQLASVPAFTVREVREQAGYPALGNARDNLVIGVDILQSNTAAGGPASFNKPGEAGRPPAAASVAAHPGDANQHALSTPATARNVKAIIDQISAMEVVDGDAA